MEGRDPDSAACRKEPARPGQAAAQENWHLSLCRRVRLSRESWQGQYSVPRGKTRGVNKYPDGEKVREERSSCTVMSEGTQREAKSALVSW